LSKLPVCVAERGVEPPQLPVAQLPVASCNWEYCPVVKVVKLTPVVKVAPGRS